MVRRGAADDVSFMTAQLPATGPRPSQLMFATSLFVGAYLLMWTVLPLISGREVPADNTELLRWGAGLAWGYPKHPPLPAWIVYAVTRELPATIPMTYALGALQVAMMLCAAWLLVRQLLGVRAACIGVLMITCITFYTNRMHFFNHNTALLVATAAATYCTWQSAQHRRWIWGIALGACWGVGMLSKYQMVVTIACNLVFLWTERSNNRMALLRGAVMAGCVAAILLLPHLLWVASHGFPTVHYAGQYVGVEHSALQRISRVIAFSADQALRLLPLLGLLLILSPFAKKAAHEHVGGVRAGNNDSSRARRFLALHAWGPLVLMNLLGLVFGLRLGMHWGTAFLWPLPLWFLATVRGQSFVGIAPRTTLISLVGVHLAMVLAFVLTS